ncbi:hypothetical protein [Tautonia rosea]|uniref:hypothetical protein n=1 Tax=Tautonia rosea TaxID=2728037 RepID=UPI001600B094|nr:hypothetical protein [Tautonia rosea]
MAAKKTATKKKTTASSTKSKAPAAAKKAAAPKAPKPPAKTTAPATSAKTKPAAKAVAKKPLKLTEAQEKILRLIDAAGETGYLPAQKSELRSIDKLKELKLVKRGAKDKETGNTPFLTTGAGKKHLASSASA